MGALSGRLFCIVSPRSRPVGLENSDGHVLLIKVRTLAIRLTTLALMLCESGPAPNAGSYDADDRLTSHETQDVSISAAHSGAVEEQGMGAYFVRGSGLPTGRRWRLRGGPRLCMRISCLTPRMVAPLGLGRDETRREVLVP